MNARVMRMWACGVHDPEEVGVVCGACHTEEIEQLRRGIVRPIETSETPAAVVVPAGIQARLFWSNRSRPPVLAVVELPTNRLRSEIEWSVVIGQNGPEIARARTQEDSERVRDVLLAFATMVSRDWR